MVHYGEWNPPTPRQTPIQERNKRPISVSSELHDLIKTLSVAGNESLEQVVSNAVLNRAKFHLSSHDSKLQSICWTQMKQAEAEIKERYHGLKSKRSARMRRINDARRRPAPTFTVPRPIIY